MNTREAKKSRTEGMATRSTLTNWFFGALISALSTNQLPTTLDILQYYLFLRESKLKNNYYMLNDKNFVFKRIASEVAEIWKTASIFTIRKEEDIRRKIASEVDKMEYIFSHNTNRRGDDNWIQLKKTEKFPGLFDIALCKCYPKLKRACVKEEKPPSPENISYQNCKCPVVSKIPEREWEFYVDQHYERNLFIELSRKDSTGTEALKKDLAKAEKVANEEERLKKQRERESTTFKSVKTPFDSESSDSSSEENVLDLDFEYNITEKKEKVDYPNTTSFAMRHGLSNYQTMGMINMVLKDRGVVDQSKFVSRKKVRNMQEKHGEKLAEEHSKNVSHEAIFLMARKTTMHKNIVSQT